MRSKLIGTLCLAMGIIIIVTTGTSFAYFTTSVDGNTIIGGKVQDFNVELSIENTYQAQQLIPLEDNKINKAVSNHCIDSKGYQVCSLFKITLTNGADAHILNAYITEETESTYTTNHLKGKIFNSDLTESLSTVTTLTNTEGRQYFKIDDNNLFSVEVAHENVVYLAIWLTETGTYQNEDYSKKFTGKIAFESISGGEISSSFTA